MRRPSRLAIFQLLDDIESKSKELALASFAFGCVNVPIHLVRNTSNIRLDAFTRLSSLPDDSLLQLLLFGTLCRTPCLMLPWLAVTLLEHIIIGVPVIVFVGIIALYLCCQLQVNIEKVASAIP